MNPVICNTYSTYGVGSFLAQRCRTSADTVRQERSMDNVQLSTNGRLAVSQRLSGLILPTEENVRKLSAKLSQDLGCLLGGLGVSPHPPLEFSVDRSGEILIKGDRPDKEPILQAINGSEKVKYQIRTTTAIAGHAAAIADSLKFQKEYVASNNPESIVAKYSYLFGSEQRSHRISLVYGTGGINVLSDGRTWLPSGA